MKGTDDHPIGDFFHLGERFSCFEIVAELSFQDRERGFDTLSSAVFRIGGSENHFLSIDTSDDLIIPGMGWDD